MKTKHNHSLTIIIGLLICWLLPSYICASVQIDGIYYDLNTSARTAAVVSNLYGYTEAIVIPSSFVYNGDTYSVTSINLDAFKGCTSLQTIDIPNSVTSIGERAFYDCTGLTSVVIPNSVTSIGREAFYGCTGLISVEIPNSLTSIGDYAFDYCTGMTSVEIPNSVTSIGGSAFSNCTRLTSIQVDPGNPIYDSRDNCNAIIETASKTLLCGCKNTIIPNSVTFIGGSAFSGCTWLTSVVIPNSVTSIGSNAFGGCTRLTSVEIPTSVTSIGRFAFFFCSRLTSVEIPNSVTSIGDYAFHGCTRLASVNIPNSVTSIGSEAFDGCTGLTSITCESEIPVDITSNVFNNVDKSTCTLYVPYGCKSAYENATGWNEFEDIAELTVLATGSCGDNVTYCIYSDMTMVISGSDAMKNYTVGHINDEYYQSIKRVVIEEGVTSIGEYAFYGFQDLTSVTIPNSVTSIGHQAFYDCDGLTSVTIPNSVTKIGDQAFYNCDGLTSVTIPNSVTKIGDSSFSACSRLTSVTIPNSVTSIAYATFYECSSLTSVNIPNSVTSIGSYAFKRCEALTSVEIPSSVTSIGGEAFTGCTSLTSITVECETPASVGNGAFYNVDKSNCTLYVPAGSKTAYDNAEGWSDFQNIVEYASGLEVLATGSCGDNVTYTIYSDMSMVISGTGAMEDLDTHIDGCESLQKLIIEDGVTSIGDCSFSGCTSLTSVTIPNSVTRIGASAFYDCTSLASVTIPNSVNIIDADAFMNTAWYDNQPDGLFYINDIAYKFKGEMPEGTEIEIVYGTTRIGPDVFSGCIGLSSIIIPNSVVTIGDHAFSGCAGLTSLTIPNSVTGIGDFAFRGCTSLTSLTIPNSVASLGDGAFSGCSGLISLTIGNGIAAIKGETFMGCAGLTSIVAKGENPAMLGYYPSGASHWVSSNMVFESVDKTNCTLFVPAGSMPVYKNANGWSEFENIVEELGVLATGTCGDNVTYTIYSDKSMVISGTGAMTNFTINYDDDTINRENNEYWSQVKTVTIEEGVTSIGNYAFSNCTELISVSIPNSVTSIGSSAFLGCEALTSITIPASVETIGADALSYTGLTHIYIEDCDDVLQFEQVTSYMEDYEDPLEYVYLGRNIKTMSFNEDDPWEGVEGNPPFSRSRNLHTLEIGDKVTYLEDWSFRSAPLESLVIGSNVQSIGIRALSSANVGQTLVIPSNVKRMGDYSLSPSISTLVLEKGSDDLELFAGYNSLELSFFGSESSIDSIYVGRNLTCSSNNIHVVCRSACFDASLRRTMNTSGEEEEFDLTEYYIPPVCATKYYFRSGASVGEYYFQNSPVEHVYNLRSSRVGNYAFFNSNVKTVSFDAEGSTTIGNGVFSGCDGLTTLSLPEGMTDIGDNAFMDCYGLTSITIPSSLKSIGGDCFFMDDTEKNVSFNVYISDLSAWCSMDIGWGGSPLIWGHLIYNGEEISNLVVPDDVQSIGMGAFDGCSTLTSVLIPESVTSIGDRAFYCTGLTSVTMKSTVPLTIDGSTFEEVDKTTCILYVPTGSKTAYEGAEYWSEFQTIVEYTPGQKVLATGSCGDNVIYILFDDMTMVITGTGEMWDYTYDTHINDDYYQSIKSVIIEEGVTSIGEAAFVNCTSLTSITIPSSVSYIAATTYGELPIDFDIKTLGAFYGCSVLSSINVDADNPIYDSRNNCNAIVTSATNKLIVGCVNSVIENSITSIGESAFEKCYGLTTMNIPNSVTSLGKCAFRGCRDLNSVTIPNSISLINIFTFVECPNLTTIYVEQNTPPTLVTGGEYSDLVFDQDLVDSGTLYVPAGSKSAYENAVGWCKFEHIVEYGEEPDTDLSEYDNIVYIEGTETIAGQRVRLSLNMNNTIAPTGFQCDVYLPDGVTAAQDEDGFYLMDISTERTTARKTDYSNSVMQPDGGLRFMCSSTNSFTFSGNEGEVAYLMVDIDPNMEEGTYPLILRNIEISDANSNPYRVSYVKTTLTVHTYTLGDANNDGSIGVSDFTAIANYIMGTPPASFVEKAADVNVDGVISVSDLTGEANIILYGTVTPNASNAKARNEATAKYANIGAKDVTAATDKEFTVAVNITGNYAYSGYQFDVTLPEGITVKDVGGQTTGSDLFMSGMIDGNTLRVLCASTTGETAESTVVNLTLVADSEGSYNIDIDNAVVSANASSYDLSKTAFCVDIESSATGISSLNGEAGKKVVVYDLQGRRQNDVQGGRIGVVNGNTIYRK